MPPLKTPGGAAVKDSEDNEIMEGALVADDMFGQGFARGVIACDAGDVLFGLTRARDRQSLASTIMPSANPHDSTPGSS